MISWLRNVLPGAKGPNAADRLVQYAAIPVMEGADGRPRIALITSRDTGRWVIPKGWPKSGKSDVVVAGEEASEEAGLIGTIDPAPTGSYTYQKRLHTLAFASCLVEVFVLHVSAQLVTWPEKHERRVDWFSPGEAAGLVDEPELAALLRALE